MFARSASFFMLALPLLAAASAVPRTDSSGQCNTGSLQCCNSVQQADSKEAAALFGLLNIAVGSITGLVGLTCNPITVIGAGGINCNAQPVCCTGNNFNGGLLVVGCSPINANV